MALHRKSFILTLVLTGLITIASTPTVWASPTSEIDMGNISPKDELQNNPMDYVAKTRRLSDRAETLSLGYLTGPITNFNEATASAVLGYSKSFYQGARGEEWQVLLLPSGQLGWTLGYKWIQAMNEWGEPYYRFGFGAIYLPSENLGTLINWKRYNLQFAFGFEDLLDSQRSLRLDLALVWSGLGVLGQVSLGRTF